MHFLVAPNLFFFAPFGTQDRTDVPAGKAGLGVKKILDIVMLKRVWLSIQAMKLYA